MEFTVYIAIALVLFAVREASNLSNRYIPSLGVFLGVGYSFIDSGYKFDSDVIMNGLQIALYSVGSVATVKYFLSKKEGTSND